MGRRKAPRVACDVCGFQATKTQMRKHKGSHSCKAVCIRNDLISRGLKSFPAVSAKAALRRPAIKAVCTIEIVKDTFYPADAHRDSGMWTHHGWADAWLVDLWTRLCQKNRPDNNYNPWTEIERIANLPKDERDAEIEFIIIQQTQLE